MAQQATIFPQLVQHEYKNEQKRAIALAAGANLGKGDLVVTVAGFATRPAAANAATGKVAGISCEPYDNTGGADGDVSGFVHANRTVDFKNDAVHPCTAAHRGTKVYASAKDTISSDAADGPPVGKLVDFNASDMEPSRPCRVSLATEAI